MAGGLTARSRMTVAARTRAAVTGVAAVSIVVAALALYVVWLEFTMQLRTADLSRQVYAISRGLAAGDPIDLSSDEPLVGIRSRLFAVEASLLGAELVLTDADGRVRFSSDPRTTIERYDIERLTGEPDELGVRAGVRPLAPGQRVIVVAAPVEGLNGDGYLVAALPVTELASMRRVGALALLVVVLLGVAGAWFVGGIVARRITAPLVRLREGAEAIAEGAWGHQVPVEGDREVASLATSFNEMSRRVEAAYTAQREFAADVSHEIRTPITSIQGFASALLGDVATDEEQRVRYATIIKQEAGRLMELSGTLLALADLDSGRVRPAADPVDTTALAEALDVRHRPVAESRGIALTIEDLGREGRPIGDELRLLQVASALVSNALKHTPNGGSVRVSARRDGDTWCLIVDDSGPGVPPEQRERIFERYVRLEDARAKAVGGGSGLGLSICQRLVDLMGGSVSVEDSDLGGARFIVRLPSER